MKFVSNVCRLLVFCGLLPAMPVLARAAQMQVMRWESRVLKANPLHDPTLRSVAVFLPAQAMPGGRLPIIYYLPGYDDSSANFIVHSNIWLNFTQRLANEVTPVVFVVVDGRTRWGGSQYLNSPAQGNYEDYICNEIVPTVEARFPATMNGVRRIVAGHSSGGFGALRLGMARQQLFDAVIALSPDSDFLVSHLPLVRIAAVTNAPLAEIEDLESGKLPPPRNGDLDYAVGLSAAYVPQGVLHPGRFDWLYDRRGNFREAVWQRWLDNDPLTIVERNPHAFGPGQSVYLDGAAQDQFSANVGARKIYEALRKRRVRCTFYEPPGHHGDYVRERLQRGLAWVFGKRLHNVPWH